jgi:hypothetical protein
MRKLMLATVGAVVSVSLLAEVCLGGGPGAGRGGRGPAGAGARAGGGSRGPTGLSPRPSSLGSRTTPRPPSQPRGPRSPESFQQLLNDRAARPSGAAEAPDSLHSAATQARENWTSTHPEPFTPAWYVDHPGAWHATHPHADAAAVAAVGGLAAWIAVPSVATATTTVVEQTVVESPAVAADEAIGA